MKNRQVSDGHVLVLKKGEALIKSLQDFCAANQISAGFITGLGAVGEAELGAYNLDTQEYRWKKFSQPMEITSLNGTVSTTTLHIHITLADENYQALGGHLKEAIVAGTCEIYLRVFNDKFERHYDQETGLNLLQ